VIVTKLMGGHSNQLFQYATARCLAMRHGTDVYMDRSWFDAIAEGDTQRSYELDGYAFEQRFIQPESFTLLEQGQRAPRRFFSRRPRTTSLAPYRQQGHEFDERVLDLPDDTYLDGWWQDERYFQAIRPTLLGEIELTKPVAQRDAAWLSAIRGSRSVSLHVRRGDYVTNPATTAFHGVLESSYYDAALSRLRELSGDDKLELFVFSNDIPWCSRHLRFEYPTTFIDSGNSGAEDMRLMRECRHHVIANSSFSWWGAWLSDHPEKIVIAPQRWFSEERANAQTEIVPPSWERI
jgi:Glycosyl transferase family 11